MEIISQVFEIAKRVKEAADQMKSDRESMTQICQILFTLHSSLQQLNRSNAPSTFQQNAFCLNQVLDEISELLQKAKIETTLGYVKFLLKHGSLKEKMKDIVDKLYLILNSLNFSNNIDMQNFMMRQQEQQQLVIKQQQTSQDSVNQIIVELQKLGVTAVKNMGISIDEAVELQELYYARKRNNIYSAEEIRILREADQCISASSKNESFKPKPKGNYPWEVKDSDVVKGAQIAAGGFSVVYKGKWKGTEVAVKEMSGMDKKQIKALIQEVTVWFGLMHDYILPLRGASITSEPPFILSMLCPHGHLRNYLQLNSYEVSLCLKFVYQIAVGMEYLHSKDLIHNDLKCANVLVDKAGDAKITDFGLSFNGSTESGGTMRWMAPERLDEESPTSYKESDVYSYAMTLYEIFSEGDLPFPDVVDNDIVEAVRDQRETLSKPKGLKRLKSSLAAIYWDLVTHCSKYNYQERPKFTTIIMQLNLLSEIPEHEQPTMSSKVVLQESNVLKAQPTAVKQEYTEASIKEYERGQALVKEKNYDEATKAFLISAEQGNAKAQSILARHYKIGRGVPKDLEKALVWFQKAAEQGDLESTYQLGSCYQTGTGIPKDLYKAFYWFQRAADMGDAESMYQLGTCYSKGEAVQQDNEKAAFWRQKSSEAMKHAKP